MSNNRTLSFLAVVAALLLGFLIFNATKCVQDDRQRAEETKRLWIQKCVTPEMAEKLVQP